ncbi:hypothetical protein [Pseudonocardia sp. TRM90224]|uniref:hypothetical protein n=1 Tax=Pseudonocardia sp. TRM90224 TaxID=2812678 RepID=UPI001E43A2CF|nr:hypothetical protein [Pseudonocardia sp. TRM90224]
MAETGSTSGLDDVADHLYEVRPDEFVPARDDAVAQAKEQGDKDLAKAIARLRRPTKAAWLANLLARKRSEQLAALISLAGDLADAQRTLDGGALRALSSQRNRLVAAMAREGGRLAHEAGDSAAESVLRELQGILEAALADPNVAAEVQSGRMTRTVAYSGFGPASDPDAVPMPAPRATTPTRSGPAADPAPAETADESDDERRREERARERAARKKALDEAEREESAATEQQERDEAKREDTDSAHTAAKAQVADLTAELERAREREREAAAAARAAASAAKESARAAGAASTRAARARARYDELADD